MLAVFITTAAKVTVSHQMLVGCRYLQNQINPSGTGSNTHADGFVYRLSLASTADVKTSLQTCFCLILCEQIKMILHEQISEVCDLGRGGAEEPEHLFVTENWENFEHGRVAISRSRLR